MTTVRLSSGATVKVSDWRVTGFIICWYLQPYEAVCESVRLGSKTPHGGCLDTKTHLAPDEEFIFQAIQVSAHAEVSRDADVFFHHSHVYLTVAQRICWDSPCLMVARHPVEDRLDQLERAMTALAHPEAQDSLAVLKALLPEEGKVPTPRRRLPVPVHVPGATRFGLEVMVRGPLVISGPVLVTLSAEGLYKKERT